MINGMADLETLGLQPGHTILSIGITLFDENGVGDKFYEVVSRESCRKYGLKEDPGTIAWWNKQSEEARLVLREAEQGRDLKDVLVSLNSWLLTKSSGMYDVEKHKIADFHMWGNGSDFDNAFLACAYAAVGKEPVWNFWNNRCYRTLKSLFPHIKFVRQGVYHNAADDAASQAQHAVLLLRALPKKRPKIVSPKDYLRKLWHKLSWEISKNRK